LSQSDSSLSFALHKARTFAGWDGLFGIQPPLNVLQLDADQFTVYYLLPMATVTAFLY